MLKYSKIAAAIVVVAGGVSLQSMAASAMPALDTHAATTASSGVEQARWVCGPFRCFWRPNYYGFYGRPYGYGFGGGYGWHRHFGGYGGWHRGWHRW